MNELQDLGIPRSSSPWIPPLVGFCSQSPIQVVYAAATSTDVLTLSGDTAAWIVEAVKKLEALGRFHAGWDSYGGRALTPGAKMLTLQVLRWLRKDELPVPAIVLGSKGNIQLEWRARGKELEVELCEDNSIEFMKVSPNGRIEEGEARSNLHGKLCELAIWLHS